MDMQGSARVIRCLQDKRESLTEDCRGMLFDEEVKFGEDIDFKYPMKAACSVEIDKFCACESFPANGNSTCCLRAHRFISQQEMSVSPESALHVLED